MSGETEEVEEPDMVGQGPERIDKPIDTSKLKSEAMDLTSSNVGEIDAIEDSAPLDIPDPDYLTNFCKNRNTPSDSLFSNMPSMDWGKKDSWGSWIIILGILVGLFFLAFLWHLAKNFNLVVPFVGGSLNILKYLIIYSIIIVVMVLLLKFTRYFSLWYNLFYKYLRLTFNPLLDPKVSELYCFFSDYVNPLIYFPSMIFFLLCLIGIVLLLVLILLPILAAVSFFVGFLFSLLGEKKTDTLQTKTLQSQGINKIKDMTSKLYSKDAGLFGTIKATMAGKDLPPSAPSESKPPKPLVEFRSGFINLSKKVPPPSSMPGATLGKASVFSAAKGLFSKK
jgi:hypothetical protein